MGEIVTSPEPKIRLLFIDDETGRLAGIKDALSGHAEVVVRHPLEVEPEDIASVDLISVDENLGEDWLVETSPGGRLSGPISILNRDGLAVAAAIRSQARFQASDNLYAVTLHTAELAALSEGLPAGNRQALTAAQHDLEWIFEFNEASFASRVLSLARASRSLIGKADEVRADFGAKWLNLTDQPWRDLAMEQITDCRPPSHALATNTGGRSFLRWLAHRVLPYPTFLLDRFHAANLLGITPESFDALTEKIEGVAYDGPLAEFLGRRWWRAGLQTFLFDAGAEHWDEPGKRAAALESMVEETLEPLASYQPVVTYSLQGEVISVDGEASECVRLQRDGWPVYADDPWATVASAVEDIDIRRLVAQGERSKLGETSA